MLFVNLKKVTNETKDVYASFAKEASEIGRQLAKTSIDVVNATTAFLRGICFKWSKRTCKNCINYQ